MKYILGILGIILFTAVLAQAIDKNENITCQKLLSQSSGRMFYVTPYEYEMCKLQGIDFAEYVITK